MNNEKIINISMEVEEARKGHETVGKRLDNFDSQLERITNKIPQEKIKGINVYFLKDFKSSGHPHTLEHINECIGEYKSLNINYIYLCPIVYYKTSINDYDLEFSLTELQKTINLFKTNNIKIAIKPHVHILDNNNVYDFSHSSGYSKVNLTDTKYKDMLIKFITLNNVDMIYICNEFYNQTNKNLNWWADIISSIRQLNPNIKITNSNTIWEIDIPSLKNCFLDLLDYVSINFYPSVSSKNKTPSVEECLNNFKYNPYADIDVLEIINDEIKNIYLDSGVKDLFTYSLLKLKEYSSKYKLIISEIGVTKYRDCLNFAGAGITTGSIDLEMQTNYIEAILQVLTNSNIEGYSIWGGTNGDNYNVLINNTAKNVIAKYNGNIYNGVFIDDKLQIGEKIYNENREFNTHLSQMNKCNPNLIKNSTGMFGREFWDNGNPNGQHITTTEYNDKNGSFYSFYCNDNSLTRKEIVSSKINIGEGNPLTLSGEFSNSSTDGMCALTIFFYNSNNIIINEDERGTIIIPNTNFRFKELSKTFITPKNTSYVKVVIVRQNCTNGETSWKNIKLEIGYKKTQYSIESDIKAVNEILDTKLSLLNQSGDSNNRPTIIKNGQMYFDTSLGKPIWSDLNNKCWRLATGEQV